MSNAVFPTLAGRGWSRARSPFFKTRIQESINGKEVRFANRAYPKWKYTLQYEVLRHAAPYLELQAIAGFFNLRRGAFDSFLYLDPNDSVAVDQPLATFNVNGISTYQYQLIRSYGGFVEPVQVPETTSLVIKADGAGSWTVASGKIAADQTTGVVTFEPTQAPGTGAVLTWSGAYYWRVRFVNDMLELNEFMKTLWELKKVEFVTDPQ